MTTAPKPEEAAQMIAKGVTSPAVADASQNQPTETGQDEFLRQALKDGAGDDHSREVSPSLPQNAPVGPCQTSRAADVSL